MDQEIIAPDAAPRPGEQGFSVAERAIAALGATLMLFCLTGAAMVATVWAFSKLIGLPDIVMYGLMVLGAAPVLWLTLWTAGRAWHVEKLLASGGDIDAPSPRIGHYFRKGRTAVP